MSVVIGIALSLVVGFVPMVAYALVLWWFDRYEKEPLGLLVAAFLWGAIPSIIFSLIAELVLDIPISRLVSPTQASLVGAAVVAPVVEEVFKGGALLLLFLLHRHEIDSPLDGIVYGGLVGFGFAAVENVFYFGSALMETGLGGFLFLALFRAFLFGLNHALFTGLIGLGMALARTATDWSVKLSAPAVGLLAGILAHSIHNASVTLGADLGWPCLLTLLSSWGGVLILLGVIIWTGVRERRWIERFLADEVERGTLSREDYETVSSHVGRLTTRAEALFGGDLRRWWRLGRYHRLATELAFNKRRLSTFPDDGATEKRVEKLRTQVEEMGGET
jgi:RsiW-degrading membrane proteinase PrsW (M82 family)